MTPPDEDGYWGNQADTPNQDRKPCRPASAHSHLWDDNGTLRCGRCGTRVRKANQQKEKRSGTPRKAPRRRAG